MKRYSLRGKDCFVYVFDDWDEVQSWVLDHSEDSPFEYWDHMLDDVKPGNSYVPLSHNA